LSVVLNHYEHEVTHNGAVLEMKWVMYLIYLLTAIGLTPSGSSTVHIYTQITHTTQLTTRTTQLTTRTTQLTT